MLPSQPKIEPVPGPWWRPSYRVTEGWYCVWRGRDGRTYRTLVPEGMPLDGSSEWILTVASPLPAVLLWACGFPTAALVAAVLAPVLLWLLGVAQDGLHRAAVVGHDHVYGPAGAVAVEVLTASGAWLERGGRLTRAEADWLLLDVQRTRGVWGWRRYPRWATVVVFGAPVWLWRKRKR